MRKQKMYFIALRHLSGVQKGVQSVHAHAKYVIKFGDTKQYKQWATTDETVIMLEAGATEILEKTLKNLRKAGIKHAFFKEPDVNNAITCICLLADEKVWNTQKYPDVDADTLFLRNLLQKFPLAT